MRAISSNVRECIGSELHLEIQYFYLLEAGDGVSSPVTRQTTLQHDVVFNGNTYLGGSRLVSVDPPRITQVVDRQVYSLRFADPDFTMRPYFETGCVGMKMTVRMGFINTSPYAMTSGATTVNPGEPLLDISDTILAYSGYIDKPAYDINIDGAVIATVECASPLGQLGLVKSFLTNKDSMHQRAGGTTDTSFDQIFVGSKGVQLLWGKVL